MKKLLGILVLGLLWCNTPFASDYDGEGELQLTNNMAQYFLKYIRGDGGGKPQVYFITTDGTDGMFWYCPETQCRPITPSLYKKKCENKTGKKCKMFAREKLIKWKNGINPGKGKISKINPKWTDTQILLKLTELGFYQNSTTKAKAKAEAKAEAKADTLASEYSVEEIRNATEIVKKLKEEGYDPNEPFASEEEIRKAIEIVKKTKIDEKKAKEEELNQDEEENENLPLWKKSAKYKKLKQKYTEDEMRFAMEIVTRLIQEGYDPNEPFATEKEIKKAIYIVNQMKKVRDETLFAEKKAEEEKLKKIEAKLKETEEKLKKAEAKLKKTEEKLIADEPKIEKVTALESKLKLVNYDCKGMHSNSDTRVFFELDKENKIVKTHTIYPGGKQNNTFKILKMNNRRVLLRETNSSNQFYWYYGTDQHTESALSGTHFYTCSIEDSSTSKIAKADTQSYSKPSKQPLLSFSKSLLGGSGSMISSSISKTELSRYNAKSATSYYFFHASSNLMASLELLYRAYDQNTQADKLQSQIRYLKESKSSEAERLKSTKQIVDVASNEIASNIKDESIVLSDQGRVYYQQSLPYAVIAAASSVLLYKVAANTAKQILDAGSGEAKLFAALVNLNEIIAIGKVAKQLPGFARNVASTTKLIFTGAKTKKIKDKANNKGALDELDLDF